MDALLFVKIISDKNFSDLKKIKYKYPDADLDELIHLLNTNIYIPVPLYDFDGRNIVYMENITRVKMDNIKLLLSYHNSNEAYGSKAMEDEIASSLTIENIDFQRESVRKIMLGFAPSGEDEERIYSMKKGLDFISDPTNIISEENIHTLYETAIGRTLTGDDVLMPGSFYRNDNVYIVGQKIEHIGISHNILPDRMQMLVNFINTNDDMNDLQKAAVIHFYIGYLHPYFDGNGRMARLIHLWYLHRQGYSSALFIPISGYILKSRAKYYKAFTLIEDNYKISKVLDVTPFLIYITENVYNKLGGELPATDLTTKFQKALALGKITEKEKDLWYFVLSEYGTGEFSTKQLERDFGRAAYATIRGFVLKFNEVGLLLSRRYSNKVKYFVPDRSL